MELGENDYLKKKFFKEIWFSESNNIVFAVLTKSNDELIPKHFELYPTKVFF